MSCSRSFVRGAVGYLLLLTAACSVYGQETPVSAEESCRALVQKFYDWYVPAAFHESALPASNRALARKDFVFSPQLRRQLKEDFAASANNKGEIVGLDFDPFLNSQDPARHYVLGKVAVKDAHCRVEVHSVESGKKAKKPDVVPELELKNGRWIFVNFHYPQEQNSKEQDLLSILNTLRDERQSNPER